MKPSFPLFMLGILLVSALQLPGQVVKCKITGTVINRQSKTLVLLPSTADPRFTGIHIPISGNHFEYLLEIPVTEKYDLIFLDELEKGAWRAIGFFPETGTVDFRLNNDEAFDNNVISGGTLNSSMQQFSRHEDSIFRPLTLPWSRKTDSLWHSYNYYSKKAAQLYERLRKSSDEDENARIYRKLDSLKRSGALYTGEVNQLIAGFDSIGRLKMYWENDYIRSHIDLHTYSIIWSEVLRYETSSKNTDITFINDIYPEFVRKFPSHPYTVKVKEILDAINNVKVGSHYVDFSAPARDGRIVKVSDEIGGKVALIDLWASWCGPCRALSKRMIPVYEKYKNKGFVIVGVACEYRNTNAFDIAMKKDQYPWLNLVELDNKNAIWNKYNISGSGGSTYLIDAKGNIVAIHPDAEELDRLLRTMLK